MAAVICRILYCVRIGWWCTQVYKLFRPLARSPHQVLNDIPGERARANVLNEEGCNVKVL
jgi:hypothetical protein